jgi:polygalacturonase
MHIRLNIDDQRAWMLFRRPMTFFSALASNIPLPQAATIIPHPIGTTATIKHSLYTIQAQDTTIPAYSNTDYDFCHFSSSTFPITLTISHTSALLTGNISPQKLAVTPSFSDGQMTATLSQAGYYIIKLDYHKEVLVLAEAAETQIPSPLAADVWSVSSFGAKSDGSSFASTTAAFERCIDAAAASGLLNATVYVPEGVFSVGNLVLKSNVALYLSSGATLRFSPENAASYKVHWHKTSQGSRPITWWLSTAFNSRNVRVYGRGVLDGDGVAAAAAGIGNNLLVPIATAGFVCEGITFLNSASWACTPIMVTDASFKDCKWINRFTDTGENDGIDVMHSQHVSVTHSIGVGLDDPFSTKTWSHEQGDISVSWPVPVAGLPGLKDVTFDDTVSWTICFGLKVGAGIWAPQENVVFRNGVVYDCSIAIGIHFQSGASYAKDVLFEDIDVENVTWTNMNLSNWCSFMVTGGEGTGHPMEDVTVRRVNVRNVGNTAAILKGAEGRIVSGVSFDRVVIPGYSDGASSLGQLNFGEVEFVEDVNVSGPVP